MKQNNIIFSAASLANGASFSMILPLLAPLVRQLKLSELQGGAMVSIGALWMAAAALYFSKRNAFTIYQLLSAGFCGMALTWGLFAAVLMYGMHAEISLGLLFAGLMAVRAGTGVFMAMPQIALQTYVMTRYAHEQARAQVMSTFGALNSIGVIIGPFLTTLMLAWGMLAPLWAAVVILLGMSMLIVLRYDRTALYPVQNEQFRPREQKQNDESIPADGQAEFSLSRTLPWLILGFSLYLIIVTVNLTAGFYLQDRFQASISQAAVYFAHCSLVVGVSLVMMQLLISKYLKWPLKRLLWTGLIIMATALCISVFSQTVFEFQSAYVLYGIAVACLIPAFTAGAAQTAPEHMQAKVAGLCTATQALGFMAGPLISTGLYQWHAPLPYYFLLLMIFSLMGFFMIKQTLPAVPETADV